ncbi:NAD(P)H-dependent oxidoreductase [Streptoalloteichus hindustanus]|uniref:NAD(P)H-dependent FMN reductase n=1 Tax=Streptoalloteichus hindustanus TaxID=2017 RepID=A0A1M5IA65_STRHI|nr:NAD(P)H-dependent oxidoreductase [Streptoalloteichus hindustanus]SHG25152.1 NAD(P)H-dependent FMN reductase [Streptoalloteichus hindustanus]
MDDWPRMAIIVDGPDPAGRAVADWLADLACHRHGIEADLLDLGAAGLPEVADRHVPTPPAVRDLAPWLAVAAGFVVVVPPRSPASLENAVVWWGPGWRGKPVAFASPAPNPDRLPALRRLRDLFTAAHAVLVDEVVGFRDPRREERAARVLDELAALATGSSTQQRKE